ncbi:ADYC domain-containing protein [Nannocystis sp. ILAH1]|uniref:ADYC domain-containing protein n=1 Tax=Nannocystis sp. ILAH1 TaxID=2996789 RepID=UPI00226FF49A|nr:ADYC domain-containing protein [Nannocystis sp. ILAH1]MCY0991045.1 ADYC domain-containing protein [Nannocystis sp. ILAH1]
MPLCVVVLAVTPACTSAPEGDELEFRETCGTCGYNSPEINDAPFPELSLAGLPNSAGVSLVGLRDPLESDIYPLNTDIRGELVVYKGDTTQVLAGGEDLVGWKLVLEKDGDEVEGTILVYNDDEPSSADEGRPFTTYAIWFVDPDDATTKNVCPTFWNQPSTPVLTVIRGETYDRENKEVDLIEDEWVTFACKDQAAFKAKAFGYEQGQIFPLTSAPATRAQQDATLKMITADYCGTGQSFTVQDWNIYWENAAGTVTPDAVMNPLHIEAVWDEFGAICVQNPRLATIEKVDLDCPGIPRCLDIDWASVPYEWITWKVM